MKGKVLVIGRIDKILAETLNEAGFSCDVYAQMEQEKVKEILADYVGLCVRSYSVKADLIEKGEKLQFIGRAGSGLDTIDLKATDSKNIKVINSPEGNADAVAEHAIGLMLNILHNIGKSDKQLRQNKFWRQENTGDEIAYKTVGIIGYGNTGSRLANRLAVFGPKILVYDKFLVVQEHGNIKNATMQEIYDETDILSIHLQHNEETHMLVCREFIEKFKKPLIVINTSRGKILNTKECLELMDENKISAMGLDVFENETLTQLSFSEKRWFTMLKQRQNVIMTPHVAGWSFQSEYKIAKILADKILKSFEII